MPRLVLSPRNPHQLLAAHRRQQCSSRSGARQFHASIRRDNAEAQNHYDALELPFTASAADIKRQFYSLSKRHHPDRNKGDPAASSRFVRISEAYHVLGTPDKRSRYDRDLARQHPHAHHGTSSPAYAGPAGSRPASGLSRRRTQFRGPPPSFYRNGAWGAHAAKRSAAGGYDGSSNSRNNPYSDTTDHHNYAGESGEHTSSSSSYTAGAFGSGGGFGGGFGPGQATRGDDAALPHWDRVAHRRTQEGISARLSRRARARGETTDEMKNGGGPWSLLINFFVVGGAIAFVASIPSWFHHNRKEKEKMGGGPGVAVAGR
ncbi:uncharacterized protein BKCO1_1110006 [Diplodia corticola]|uniref:J domain-containing protein n=1 Tax=Diplodia corticola TaxID=236234 RepID=A0A1J9R8R2_9PEZI|nr:uncharacterized protein BKCO1_1110006 [Diplodia corticola]OJD28795.1 hypothetical protein BKCO1_1110006 [Diplodia corticola]